MNDYWSMGGYAAFVWPAYGLSAIVMLGLAIGAWRGVKVRERDLARLRDQLP
jgi:heme exporter protein D